MRFFHTQPNQTRRRSESVHIQPALALIGERFSLHWPILTHAAQSPHRSGGRRSSPTTLGSAITTRADVTQRWLHASSTRFSSTQLCCIFACLRTCACVGMFWGGLALDLQVLSLHMWFYSIGSMLFSCTEKVWVVSVATPINPRSLQSITDAITSYTKERDTNINTRASLMKMCLHYFVHTELISAWTNSWINTVDNQINIGNSIHLSSQRCQILLSSITHWLNWHNINSANQ